MFHVFVLYKMLMMYDHQLVSSERITKLLLPRLRSLGMKSWSFLPIRKRGIDTIINMEHRAFPCPPVSLLPTLNHTLTLMATSPPFDDDDPLSNLNPLFAGLFQRVSPDKEEDVPSAAEVVDDYEGEQETLDLQNSTSDNHGEADADDNDSDNEEDTDDEASVGFSGLEDVVKNASKGVTEGTDGEYRRSEKILSIFLAGLPLTAGY